MTNLLVPQYNIETFKYLYGIENALRELIIEKLGNIVGQLWYRSRLPSDVLEKYRNAIKYERSFRWLSLIPSHPIYYIDFSDLRKIIERTDNWEDTFRSIFVRKEIVSSMLSELEYIRNKVAHNRNTSSWDLDTVKTTYDKLSKCVGVDYFISLSSKYTSSTDILSQLKLLRAECDKVFVSCLNCEKLLKNKNWNRICKEWWFDETYLDHKLCAITKYFYLVEEYCRLPRERGSGHLLEQWIKDEEFESKYEGAIEELGEILRGRAQ